MTSSAEMRSGPGARWLRAVPGLMVGALVTALAAQVSVPIPGSPVPQSIQTLAVVVVGGVLGAGRGGVAMLVYIAMGAAGLPVFADGGAGVARLWGPTGGYLAGFAAGAVLAGWWTSEGRRRKVALLAAGMAAAHVAILSLGWARLAMLMGPGGAWSQGVAPFLWGGAVKSLIAAGILAAWARWGPGWPGDQGGPSGTPEPVEPGTPPV